ncbi:hypothetical protein SAMN05444392_11328 [Seinonella peptonophila]|uniref:Uncharacterized protein n=2 Tax=Seinonella peptonophila TaxID=112248 RepID=A0A1M5AC90_9BACL|nr:hypothetical protein SAMN05444392_11328 [Seinonella peptonophila]
MKEMVIEKNRTLNWVGKIHAVSLFVAALGILILYFSGVPGFPLIPPGPIILGIAGILVFTLASRWKWIPFISVLAGLFISFGTIIEGSIWGRLTNISDFAPFVGTLIQGLGLVVAVITGLIVLAKAFRPIETV